MKNTKRIIDICCCLCVILIVVAAIFIFKSKDETEDTLADKTENKVINLAQVKETFAPDIQALKDGKYENLISTDFQASIEDVEGVYNIEIYSDNSFQERTYLENFAIMNEVIDKFFMEDFDKSYLVADLYLSDWESIDVNYHDVEEVFSEEKYHMSNYGFLFGQYDIDEGKYMVQIGVSLNNAWFSKLALGDIHPSHSESAFKAVYPYVSCIRQVEDAVINLQDGEIKLSEMEERVLNYLNSEDFPLPKNEAIRFGIADVRILENGEYDGVCFKVRRIYKGIPFEYSSNVSSGMYIDEIDSDRGELSYAVSTSPDTMLSFGRVNGTVVETETITNMLSAGEALDILSEEIGENSIYDVYGVELVYRNCEIPEERQNELDDILAPKWKITTINQNDNKYTLFYVDVMTGEVTERFEYYYDE